MSKTPLSMHLIHPNGDGSLWVLASDTEIATYRKLDPHTSCEHIESEVRDYKTKTGGWQRKPQCIKCGVSTGQAIKRDIKLEVPSWDIELSNSWKEKIYEQRRGIEEVLIERTANMEVSGYADYESYLKSDEWKVKRGRILKRDGGLCQACLDAPAVDVHHFTYERIFDEFMFELVSVCRSCHKKLHQKKIAALKAKLHSGEAET